MNERSSTPDSAASSDDVLPSQHPVHGTLSSAASRGWKWWFQLIQVRLRFIVMIGLAAILMTQWTTLKEAWDGLISTAAGFGHSHEVASGHEYFCPMDPGVLSAWPAICPICNMDLVPRKSTDGQILPEGVIARMQLSPHRVQLAGLRTSVVKPWSGLYRMELEAYTALVKDSSSHVTLSMNVSDRDARAFRQPLKVRVLVNGREFSTDAIATLLPNRFPQFSTVQIEVPSQDAENLEGEQVVRVIAEFDPRLLLTEQELELLGDHPLLQVPASAVVDHGSQQIVFVQSMSGMFDGVAVNHGPRMGAFYPVLSGLKEGQEVVTTGAFLVDAEARLNPALATGYFGADQPANTGTSALAPVKTIRTASKEPLSEEDVKLVQHQKICPVTELSLDSMGGPVPVMVGTRKVFICCAGCEKSLLNNPEKFLARIPPEPATSADENEGR